MWCPVSVLLTMAVCVTAFKLLATKLQPCRFYRRNTLLSPTVILLFLFILSHSVTLTKRLCIFGPKGAIQIHYYNYYNTSFSVFLIA